MERIRQALRNRGLKYEHFEKEIDEIYENNSRIVNEIGREEKPTEIEIKTIKDSSQYHNYFKHLLKNFCDKIENINPLTVFDLNEYYNPDLFQIIENYLYLTPLWSGIFISNNKYSFSRLSNNPVESWFKHLKINMLRNQKVMPSQFVGILYKRILAKYLLYYNENEFKLVNPIKSKIGYEEEKWKKGEPKKKRQKGFYFEKTSNFGIDLNLKNIKG